MSMKIPKKRSILFFPGIFIERSRIEEVINNYEMDLINSQLKLIEGSNDSANTYDKIPSEFRNKKNWLQETNLLCSTCSKPIDGQPIPLPLYIVHDEHAGECVYKGITSLHHSWTCASRYNTTHKENNMTGYFALRHLHQSWNNLKIPVDIPIGLPHTDMLQYGGKLTDKQWDDLNRYLLKDSLNRAINYNT